VLPDEAVVADDRPAEGPDGSDRGPQERAGHEHDEHDQLDPGEESPVPHAGDEAAEDASPEEERHDQARDAEQDPAMP
jgi:hypothetical protein